jgi:hypothetical protein
MCKERVGIRGIASPKDDYILTSESSKPRREGI